MHTVARHLAHQGQNKMGDMLQTKFSNQVSGMEGPVFWFKFQLYFYYCPIGNSPALVQIMAWFPRDEWPISDLVLYLFTYVNIL